MDRAMELLMPIVKKYKIEEFKMRNPLFVTKTASEDNVEGKNFCISFHEDSRKKIDNYKNILPFVEDVERAFSKAGLERGIPSKGDMGVKEKGFCFYRNSKNIFYAYLGAAELEKRGFSLEANC